MNFAAPLWLMALPLLAFLALMDLRRRADVAQRQWPLITRLWASLAGLRPTVGDSFLPKRIALWMGLAICIFALARPRWGSSEIKVLGQAREVLIALDLSRSMTAKDVPPTRLERAKVLVSALLGALRGERVGLIVFAGTAFLQSPLSPDYEVLREFLPGLDPAYLPQGGTDYDQLLRVASEAFGKDSDADRFLVILSDGESHTDAWRRHLGNLKANNIRAITLGVGTAKGSLIPTTDGGFLKDERGAAVLSKLNSSTLEELARTTGGAYRDASGWVDIAAVINATVAKGTRGQYEDQVQRLYIERFQWFLAPGVLLLIISLWRELPSVPKMRTPRRRKIKAVPARFIAPPPVAQVKYSRSSSVLPLLLLLICAPGERATAQEMPSGGAGSRLKELLRSVPAKPSPSAPDFASVARATIEAGIDPMAFKEDPEARRPTILDGIDAVDAGERIDPKAAPWGELRDQLRDLLQEPPQQKDQNKKEQEKGKKKDKEDKGSGSRQDQQSENEKSENAKQQQQDSPSDKQPSDGKESPEQQSGQRDKTSDQSQSLSGLTNKNEKAQPPEKKPGSTQKVGGKPTESEREAKENPELSEAFRRYERARDLDSPARLAQILDQMDGKQEEQPKKGKDW